MGSLQEEQPLTTALQLQQEPRAKSEPIQSTSKDATAIMGRAYRTPSPTRASYLRSVTPKERAFRFLLPQTTGAPSTPRRNSRFECSTPIAQPGFTNAYGLLTPSTPGFGSTDLESPTFRQLGEEHGKYRFAGAQVPFGHDDTASDATLQEDVSATDPEPEALTQQLRTRSSKRRQPGVFFVEVESDDEEPLKTHFDKLQQHIRDSELAAQLADEQGTSRTRRSTRISQKETVKVDTQVVAIPTKSAKASKVLPAGPPPSPPESSLAEEAVVQHPPDLNPALFTLDWQLQYPPGGSTHPSYAYPQLDPRLLFNPSLVPIVEGLPAVLAVPPLVLPLGWRHISWSGLLPIAFDPYHQAFKLTPVGPLPLTCEEVQQGGLAKFVPGGECHPEAGLLPDATTFSDGSDGERYNFEDVDWVLPWPPGETFDGSSALVTPPSPGAAATRVRELSAPRDVPPPFYFEARDCPDGIVDIEDAWRWITEKEMNPNAAFVPSPTKTSRGKGIARSGRRHKTPIASLMGSIIVNMQDSPDEALVTYLLRQDGREFCPFRSMATPVHVNITLLGDVDFTLKELICYFPTHYMWPKGATRLTNSGMSGSDIANMINMVRQLSGEAAKVGSSIRSSMNYALSKASEGGKVSDEEKSEAQSYTAEGWTYESWELVDYPILGLAHGLVKLPEGVDAGPLTQLIVWCRENKRFDVLLSKVPDMLQEAGITSLIEPSESGCPDKEVLGRYAATLKKDRQRVLAVAKERKRLAEEEEGGREKRVKTE